MNQYSKTATSYFRQGYNCSQSVFLTFAPILGIDQDTAARLASSFGGGMGRLREVCGAVSAMFLIAGLYNGYTSPTDYEGKTLHYKRIQELANEFKALHHSIICRELLKLPSGADSPVPEKRDVSYYQSRPCEKFIGDAAYLISEYIARHTPSNSDTD